MKRLFSNENWILANPFLSRNLSNWPVFLLRNLRSQNVFVFHFSVKSAHFPENAGEIGVLKRISRCDIVKKGRKMQSWNNINLLLKIIFISRKMGKKLFDTNAFNKYACKYHVFLYKNKPENVSGSIAALNGKK